MERLTSVTAGTIENRHGKLWAVVVAALLLVAAPCAQANDGVVLVSWDGTQRATLNELLEWQPLGEDPRPCPNAKHDPVMPTECNGHLTCLPALCNFQIIDSAVTEGKPMTRPQHAQLLSGYGPEETGEITNAGVRSLPPGMSIYERIKDARPDIFTVHIAGRKFVGRGIIRWARDAAALDVDLDRGGPDDYTGANTTRIAVDTLDEIGDAPFFMFIHYKAADVSGHVNGSKSEQYREAIVQNDLQLQGVLDALMERDLLPTTEVFVTTDHGFYGIFHLDRTNPDVVNTWFASLRHNLIATQASNLDVTPTVLTQLGVPLDTIVPPYRGRSLVP